MADSDEAIDVAPPTSTAAAPRRPIILWPLLLVTLYMTGYVVLTHARGYVVAGGRHIPLPDPFALKLLRTGCTFLDLVSVIQLFRLRASSTSWFGSELLARIGLTLIDLFHLTALAERRHTTRHVGFTVLVMVLSLAYTTAQLAYAQHLRKRRVLT